MDPDICDNRTKSIAEDLESVAKYFSKIPAKKVKSRIWYKVLVLISCHLPIHNHYENIGSMGCKAESVDKVNNCFPVG